MTDTDESTVPQDGRVARRQRNIDNVVDVVLEMFAEESLFPTIEQAANRSGLSLRSLYRYFADPAELLEAAIARSHQIGSDAAHLSQIGKGPFAKRVDDFVAMRLRLYNTSGPGYRATAANAARHPRIADELSRTRTELREQFELQFATELGKRDKSERSELLSAGDLLTQMDSVDFLRRHRGLSENQTAAVLRTALTNLLR